MKKVLFGLIVIIGVAAAAGIFYARVHNRLAMSEENVKNAWSKVENAYKKRLELVPKFVETVKGYVAQEREILQNVTDARQNAVQVNVTAAMVNDPALFAQFQKVQDALSLSLSGLTGLTRHYPELKASQNFLALQTQLKEAEKNISDECKQYNETIHNYNALLQEFPNNLIGNIAGFKQKAYFETGQAVSKVPMA